MRTGSGRRGALARRHGRIVHASGAIGSVREAAGGLRRVCSVGGWVCSTGRGRRAKTEAILGQMLGRNGRERTIGWRVRRMVDCSLGQDAVTCGNRIPRQFTPGECPFWQGNSAQMAGSRSGDQQSQSAAALAERGRTVCRSRLGVCPFEVLVLVAACDFPRSTRPPPPP